MAEGSLADERASLHDSFYFPDPQKPPPLIVTDWDLHDVPLHGLDLSKTAAIARVALKKGHIKPLEEDAVRFEIKTLAVVLCNHQREAPVWIRSVLNGRNTIAYFMLSLFAPGPKTPERKGCNQARLRSSKPLPLEHWEKLYYICVAEVRRLYADLQERFGIDFANGEIMLHYAGPDADGPRERLPWSAVAMASLLEDMWMTLHDPRVLSALDTAVKERQASELISDISASHNVKGLIDMTEKLVDAMEGVKDTSDMAPADIMNMVWLMEAAEIRQNAQKGVKDISVLAIASVEIREAGPCDSNGRVRPTDSKARCVCGPTCHCKSRCAQHIEDCTCTKYRCSVRNLILQHYGIHNAVPRTSETKKAVKVSGIPSAAPEQKTPMQISPDGKGHDIIVRVVHSIGEEAEKLDKQFLKDMKLRDRSTKSDSALAYIPEPHTPSRAPKDAFPLGFYGEHSRQRYPPMPFQSRSQPPPVYGSSTYSSHIPPRKPVPASLDTSGRPNSDPFNDTLPDSSQFDSYPVTYPTIPKSQSAGLFTQSAPRARAGHPRVVKDTDTSVSAADYHALTTEARETFRPFEEHEYESQPQLSNTQHYYSAQLPQPYNMSVPMANPTRPTLQTTATAPAGLAMGIASSRDRVDTDHRSEITLRPDSIDMFTAPQLPVPDPDFITPRPAVRQRYVSAGGHAKLHEREEIEGPPLPPTYGTGGTVQKEELDRKMDELMSNAEWVKREFGLAAVAKAAELIEERESQDSSYGAFAKNSFASQKASGETPKKNRSSRGSGVLGGKRDSREHELVNSEKRDRAHSASSTGSNSRFEKIKRAFSRKSGDGE